MSTATAVNTAVSKPKKFTFWQMILFGFNFMVGYAFLVGMGSSFANTGNLFLVMLLVCAFIAFAVGLCFARLSAFYTNYGGSYTYAKHAFKRPAAFAVGWLQYAKCPMIMVSAVSGVVWAFSGTSVFNSYEVLIFIITIFVFIALYAVVTFGFASTMWTAYILWFFKWVILLAVIVIALTRITHFAGNFNEPYTPPYDAIGFTGFVFAIVTFFFAFGGFEGIAVLTEDLHDSQTNMRRTILWLILSATVFYIVYHLLLLCSIGKTGVYGMLPHYIETASGQRVINKEADPNIASPNPLNNLFFTVFGFGLGSALLIPAIFSQVCNKLTAPVQYPWVNSRMIACLARDGHLPYQFAERNKHHQFQKAIILDAVLAMTIIVIYVIMVAVNPNYKNKLDATLDLYALVAFTQYLGTFAAYFSLYRKDERVKKVTKPYDLALFGVVSLVLIFLLGSYVYGGISSDIHSIQHGEGPAFILQIACFFSVIILGFGIYGIGKLLRWEAKAQYAVLHNIIEYPGVNTALDSIATEIKVVKKEIFSPAEDYETVQEIEAKTKTLIETEHLSSTTVIPMPSVDLVPPVVQTIHLKMPVSKILNKLSIKTAKKPTKAATSAPKKSKKAKKTVK